MWSNLLHKVLEGWVIKDLMFSKINIFWCLKTGFLYPLVLWDSNLGLSLSHIPILIKGRYFSFLWICVTKEHKNNLMYCLDLGLGDSSLIYHCVYTFNAYDKTVPTIKYFLAFWENFSKESWGQLVVHRRHFEKHWIKILKRDEEWETTIASKIATEVAFLDVCVCTHIY